MLKNIERSLTDLLGEDYMRAVCAARSALTGEDEAQLLRLANERVAFCPADYAARQEALMERIGTRVAPAFDDRNDGAPTDSFRAAQHSAAAPLSAAGCYRVGEDGRLYFAGKSEHYHIPLGHDFPGYRLVELAKRLGIPNATHNNTRGYITRLAERRLIAAANGIEPPNHQAMEALLQKRERGVLNRVINLETGSLAVEAALKMMLSRFYSIDGKEAPYAGRTPVFLVMGDMAGGLGGNYHGTTVLAQTLRGLWPEYAAKAEAAGLYRVVGVPINDPDAFAAALNKWNMPPFKTAGFCHEIILMNYGGVRLDETYLQQVYRLCAVSDTPVLCDEIQSCAWYDGMFLFRKYGIKPDFVSVGKGFPGGNYPASRILASGAFDTLNQFGALVTNGQEELASLCYLITMEFIRENGAHIAQAGSAYRKAVVAAVAAHPSLCFMVEGDAHMSAICFHTVEAAVSFCERMQREYGVDISAQTYKPNCPPVALTKVPIVATDAMVERLAQLMGRCLDEMEREGVR